MNKTPSHFLGFLAWMYLYCKFVNTLTHLLYLTWLWGFSPIFTRRLLRTKRQTDMNVVANESGCPGGSWCSSGFSIVSFVLVLEGVGRSVCKYTILCGWENVRGRVELGEYGWTPKAIAHTYLKVLFINANSLRQQHPGWSVWSAASRSLPRQCVIVSQCISVIEKQRVACKLYLLVVGRSSLGFAFVEVYFRGDNAHLVCISQWDW